MDLHMTGRNTICRECGVDGDFYFKVVDANGGYGPRLLPLGWFRGGSFRLRVCGHCGLTDWFVVGADLAKVREKFDRKSNSPGLE
jgi:hypothetical protein